MAQMHPSPSAAVRARLNHPVIDSDGHMVESESDLLDALKQVAGSQIVERFNAWGAGDPFYNWYHLSPEERRDRRSVRVTWWLLPAKNTLDRATSSLPKLLYERLDEMGLDFAVLYPTLGLPFPHIDDSELRQAACRAYNTLYADIYREYADRLTPAAIIPMHTPEEAIAELDHAVNGLGLKAVLFPSFIQRPIASVARQFPGAAREAFWMDSFGLDSEYDYDPVWTKCVELKVAPAFHSSLAGRGTRRSISNYMYNHIGMFSAAGEALCKSLFMGGVTRRFPQLKFGFLEGGVGWACSLYVDLIGHWEKRNRKSLENYNPANVDRALFGDLYARYGGGKMAGTSDSVHAGLGLLERMAGTQEDPSMLDEWAACQIEAAEDIRDLFVPNFYFGCEADDPINAWAFNTQVNPFGARLKALFGSDIGHWDVPDMTEVTEEAYELVEHGLITEANFKEFVFTNPVSFYAGANPEFFDGTVVEDAARNILSSQPHS